MYTVVQYSPCMVGHNPISRSSSTKPHHSLFLLPLTSNLQSSVMLLLQGDYDDIHPQPSPAPRVGQSPQPPSPTCEQLHNIIIAWHKHYGNNKHCACMEYYVATWRFNVHERACQWYTRISPSTDTLLFFCMLSVSLSARA